MSVGAFDDYLRQWHDSIPAVGLNKLLEDAGGPEGIAVFCVDVIRGFCTEGPLASERVRQIVAPIRELFVAAHESGVRRFYLPQDSHPEQSLEFADFGRHCVSGTSEAQTVLELAELPFAHLFVTIEKRSIASHIGTDLENRLQRDGTPRVCLAVGDCTDLCLYQLAVYLKLRANAFNHPCRVLVPENCVQTYDLPVAVAEKIGAKPHDGDFLHLVFLYHLWLNGIEIVRRVEFQGRTAE